jgi:methyl-accepting chemotaxis protein
MGILDDVMKMRNEGKSDDEITQILKERNVSPKEINDVFNQARIKSAVNHEYNPPQNQEVYTPQTYEQQEQQEYSPQNYQQNYYQPESYENYTSGGGIDTDTMIEISEQVFQDKIKSIQKQVESITELKTILQSTIENLSDRLKRIENVIDKLQSQILEKVGSYGDDLRTIRKEMGMMQDSFGKMVNNVAEKNTKPSIEDVFPKNQPRKISRKI